MIGATPFPHGGPIEPSQLINRSEELKRLAEVCAGGIDVRLTAPRRYGKSSLLLRLLHDLDGTGLTGVYVDLYAVLTMADLADRVERAYRSALRGPLRNWLDSVLGTLRPTGRIGAGPVGMEIGGGVGEPGQGGLLERLALPHRIADRTGRTVVVVMDEFQAVLAAGREVDGVIRSEIQRHGEAVSYVFAGSHPGMMRELFADRARPFYGQAQPMELGPLPADEAGEEIARRFQASDRDLGAALGPLLDLARGHPQRLMQMSAHVWAATPEGATADEETWQEALNSIDEDTDDEFQARWEALGDSERRALSAVAAGLPPTGKLATRTQGAGASSMQHGLKTLEEGGEIRRELDRRARWIVVDPLLSRWVSRKRA